MSAMELHETILNRLQLYACFKRNMLRYDTCDPAEPELKASYQYTMKADEHQLRSMFTIRFCRDFWRMMTDLFESELFLQRLNAIGIENNRTLQNIKHDFFNTFTTVCDNLGEAQMSSTVSNVAEIVVHDEVVACMKWERHFGHVFVYEISGELENT